MRQALRHRCSLLAGGHVALLAAFIWAALSSEGASGESLIKFDNAIVEGVDLSVADADTAHRAHQAEEAAQLQGGAGSAGTFVQPREERVLDIALELRLIVTFGDPVRFSYPDRKRRLGTGREQTLESLRRSPEMMDELEDKASRIRKDWDKPYQTAEPAPLHPPLAFVPGQQMPINPSFVEEGFRVEAFWAARIGRTSGYFLRGHFHPPDLSTGFEAQHLGNRSELHGIHVRSVDGRPFGLRRLRYRVTMNRQIPAKPFSIDGYSNFNGQLLVARSFDPRRSVREQFTAFPVGAPLGNDPSLPWQTLTVAGFEYVQEVFIASSASMDLDDIVVVRYPAD